MRLEATVPKSKGEAIVALADELGISRSQLIDEALALFLKVVLESRQGRKLFTQAADDTSPACELSTPTLTTLEWVRARERVVLSQEAIEQLQALVDAPETPNDVLRAAARRHR